MKSHKKLNRKSHSGAQKSLLEDETTSHISIYLRVVYDN